MFLQTPAPRGLSRSTSYPFCCTYLLTLIRWTSFAAWGSSTIFFVRRESRGPHMRFRGFNRCVSLAPLSYYPFKWSSQLSRLFFSPSYSSSYTPGRTANSAPTPPHPSLPSRPIFPARQTARNYDPRSLARYSFPRARRVSIADYIHHRYPRNVHSPPYRSGIEGTQWTIFFPTAW